ncbi:MAG: aldehyde ferredoxin oxidoreductase N-terminal domain-containing protein, partial [Halodesulfurarchaeum sp.]
DRSTGREPIPSEWLTTYVGGKGLGARYLYRELDAGVDPLGPENALLFVVGPITGLTPGEPRYAAITKSPLTGAFLDSYSGGDFAARLARSLGDAMGLIVRGSAETPVTIVVGDGSVRIESASDDWGRPVDEIADRYSDESVATIGPAGERQVLYATIGTDGGDHQAGRAVLER